MGIVSRFQQWRGARILIGNFKSLHRYLQRNGWDFKGDAERQILCGRSVPNEVGEDVSFEIGYTEMNMYAVMTLKLDVPQDRIAEIAELVCRINPGTMVGHFELDVEGRKIRYRVKIPHEEFHHESQNKTDRMMLFPIIMLILAKPAFAKVIKGEASVVDAFREYEGRKEAQAKEGA